MYQYWFLSANKCTTVMQDVITEEIAHSLKFKKRAKDFKRHFTKENMKMTNQHILKMANSFNQQGNSN